MRGIVLLLEVVSVLVLAMACATPSVDQTGGGNDLGEGAAAGRASSLDGVLGSEDDEGEGGEVNGAERDLAESKAIMTLPAGVERLDIDRFLRERRTFMVRYLPLEDKFATVHQAFVHKQILDDESTAALRRQLEENPRQTHWLFLHGCLAVQEVLADPRRPLLLDEQKAVIAHYGRTLNFMGRVLDQEQGGDRYRDFVRRLYRRLANRYLYRELKRRGTGKDPSGDKRNLEPASGTREG